MPPRGSSSQDNGRVHDPGLFGERPSVGEVAGADAEGAGAQTRANSYALPGCNQQRRIGSRSLERSEERGPRPRRTRRLKPIGPISLVPRSGRRGDEAPRCAHLTHGPRARSASRSPRDRSSFRYRIREGPLIRSVYANPQRGRRAGDLVAPRPERGRLAHRRTIRGGSRARPQTA